MKPATLWVALTSLLLLAACSKQPQWTLFYYPDTDIQQPNRDKSDVEPQTVETLDRYHVIAGYYQTLQQCQDKAEACSASMRARAASSVVTTAVSTTGI